MLKKLLITQEGLREKQTELETLSCEREKAVAELQDARELGDRSENGAYKAARWKLSGLDRRIRYLRKVIERAEVVQRKNKELVELGAIVEIVMEGYKKQFTIVGSEESDLANGKLSFFSPMGKSLMGKKEGDTCIVQTPKGPVEIVITRIQ